MSNIRIANAPCSWGSLEFEGLEGEAIDYKQMLDELAETGYLGTELGDWGYMPTDGTTLQTELSARKLKLLGAFVPVALKDASCHESGRQESLKVARLLATVADREGQIHRPFLVLADDNGTDVVRTKNAGRISPEMGLNPLEWELFAQGAQDIAQAVKVESGLSTVFHHHCAGYIETPAEIARLMKMTDPELLGLVFDTGHFAYGSGTDDNGAMVEFLDRFADRIWYMHFKDCQPEIAKSARRQKWDYLEAVRRGVFCELGCGCVDFSAVVNWLRQSDYDGWAVVEQDVLPGLGTPKDSARRNRDYLHSIGV
ncbi:MAG: TIM barrel protein [Aeoliella sp.]